MAGRMMTEDDFEDTFADELVMMQNMEQEEQEFESSYNFHSGQSRKRAGEAPSDETKTPEKQQKLLTESDMHNISNSSFNGRSMPAPALTEAGRRPLRTSNQGSGRSFGSQDVYRSGKGISSIDEFDENSGDLFVDPESEIFTLERQDNRGSEEDLPISRLDQTMNKSNILSVPPSEAHVSITGSQGHRVYLLLRSSQKAPDRRRPWMLQSQRQLLTVPFSQLKASVEEVRQAKLMEDSQEVLDSLSSGQYGDETPSMFDSESTPGAVVDHQLWVDKYAPRLYTDLLSDDGINRTLLSWLRLWDEAVFGSPTPLKNSGSKDGGGNAAGKSGGDRRGGRTGTGGGAGGGAGGKGMNLVGNKKFDKRVDYQNPDSFSVVEALDENKRPKLMLALLCGPPGLGKTTLAHTIARHAGYNVVEMNASDDRSLEVFRNKIEAATRMKSVLAKDGRPNCLIIDEIDGAPTPAINYLVDLAKAKLKGKEMTLCIAMATFPGKKVKELLSRPIICICNDQYTPALRQLRQISLLLHFPPTITSRLAARLHQVVKKEGMKSDMSTLMALCEKADNDVRACLNNIQFLGRKQKDLTLHVVQNASIGQKDAQRSLFSLWKEVFHLPTVGKKRGMSAVPLQLMGGANAAQGHEDGKRSVSSNTVRFHSLLSTAFAVGEYMKVANGLFENYLQVKFKDPNLELVTLGHEWLTFHDIVQHRIAVTQDYGVFGYLPYLSVIFHFLFAIASRSQIKYPSIGYEVTSHQQRNHHMLSSLLLGMPPPVKQNLSPTTLSVETLPPLCEIISPTFRPVNTQLYSAQEKRQLTSLVDTMISYDLMYKQEKGQDGQYTYILDPSIEDVAHFTGLLQRRQLTYGAKQLISREIEMEKLRRSEAILTSKTHEIADKKLSTQKKDTKKPVVPVIKEVKQKVDFFGRKIPIKQGEMTTGRKSSGPTHPLWFRFNEGFSNAVRRPVYIKDLL